MGDRSGARPTARSFALALAALLLTTLTPLSVDPVAAAPPSSPLAVASPPAAGEELVYIAEGNRMRRFDPDTLDDTTIDDIYKDRAASGPNGRDLNGATCAVPDGSGRVIIAEDSGQPTTPPGWGVFDADRNQIGKLTATYYTAGAEPYGCAFDRHGRLLTTEVGSQGFGVNNGQLIMWFPTYDQFPGAPGEYPATSARSTNFCKLAVDLGTAGEVEVDAAGRIYVAETSGLKITRFSPPFPTGPTPEQGCGATDALGSPLATTVQRETFVSSDNSLGMLTFSGLAMAPKGNLYAASVLTGRIAEYDLNGAFVRHIVAPAESLPPISTGTPQGIAVGADGTLYYADLDLVGTLPNVRPGPNGKLWRVRFDATGVPQAPEIVRAGLAFPDAASIVPGDLETDEWRTFAGSYRRLFSNPDEDYVDPSNVDRLREKWRFPTGAIINASPAVALVELPGEGPTRVVFFPSWDGNVYAVRLDDGSEVWRFTTAPHPGASFYAAASVDVSTVSGEQRVVIGTGETLYSLDAATGEERWHFEAGTGCRDALGNPPGLCSFTGERNQIEASVVSANGAVYFGMDVNDQSRGKGGFYAVDALTGEMRWFFDLESGAVCRPDPDDEIRRFDGYHTEAELGLPTDFLATRSGCAFPRTKNGCGNVWSSPAWDADREHLYIASSNCDTDTNPATGEPDPPMPPYDEALFVLDADGSPVWRWRPREVDNLDLAFGASPQLFTITRGGVEREVVGIGNKDGTYYVLDRDGVNGESGLAWDEPGANNDLPYWKTNVVAGGAIGGIVQTSAVDEAAGVIYSSTAPGLDVFNPQRPTVHAFDADTGAILWQHDDPGQVTGDASFGPTSTAGGVVFVGAALSSNLRMFDGASGQLLASKPVSVGGFPGVASGAAVVDGTILVGHGLGQRGPNPASAADLASRQPSSVVAFCVAGAPGCPNEAPAWPDISDRTEVVGAAVSVDFAASDADGDPLHVTASGLPPGLEVSSDGVVSGVIAPSAVGVHRVVISASDGAALSSQTFIWSVVERVVDIGDVAMLEGDAGNPASMRFAVTLSSPAPADVVVEWTIGAGTASADEDYRSRARGGRTTIRAGKVSAFASVTVFPDQTSEPDETVDVELQSATGPATLGRRVGRGVILNDDAVIGTTVGAGDASVVEAVSGDVRVSIPITLSSPVPEGDVYVTCVLTGSTATAGVDYREWKKPLTVRIRATRTVGRAAVTVHGDSVLEGAETFQVTITGVTATGPITPTIGRALGTGTILNR